MSNNKIYWKDLITMLKQGQEVTDCEIEFRNEKVDFKDVALLNRNGFRVNEDLILYDDDIDFSDDPDLTDEEVNRINTFTSLADTLAVEPEIKEWIKNEKIDINTLAAQLIRNFYETMINIPKNAAI
ncbi:MAG: hypothetical protein RIS47_2086 [Bacteroidota bacterium]|jgi:hypothetical protein